MTTILILTSIVCFAICVFCEWAEQKSRKWYRDRTLLRASGLFFGCGLVTLALGIAI